MFTDIKISGKESTPMCFKATRSKNGSQDKTKTAFTNVTFDQLQVSQPFFYYLFYFPYLQLPVCIHNTLSYSYAEFTYSSLQIDSASCPCSDFYARSRLNTKFDNVEVEPPKPAHIPIIRPSTAPNFSSLNKALDVDLTLIVLWKVCVYSKMISQSFGFQFVKLQR